MVKLTENETRLLEAAYEMGFFDHVEDHMGASQESVVALILACQTSAIQGMLPDVMNVSKRSAYKNRAAAMESRVAELIAC